MEDQNIISEISDYCKKSGLSPSTVCVRATGNSRFVERHKRRLSRIKQDEAKLRQFMAENPPLQSDMEGT
jgi:hypothetical protein